MAQSTSLSAQLRSAMHRENGSISRMFLPLSRLHELITPESASAELECCLADHDKPFIADWVTAIFQDPPSSRVRILAILALIDKAASISPFLASHVSDSLLPITIYKGDNGMHISSNSPWTRKSIANREATSLALKACFKSWPSDTVRMFEASQWSFLSPVLKTPSTMQDIQDSVFDAKVIMPFTNHDPDQRGGGYSDVFKVVIHPGHHSFVGIGHALQEWSDRYFAVKRLKLPNKVLFLDEADCLMAFRERPHPNIIPLLAAYQHGMAFNFVFPWADSDLLSYWKTQTKHPQPKEHKKMMLHLRGVADAVGHVHSERPSDELFGRHLFRRHGDIKPENILWYESSCVFALCDFGLSRMNAARSSGNTYGGGTRQYFAPECELGEELAPPVDIWAFGCVYVETVTWMLYGWEGVVVLRELIGNQPLYEPECNGRGATLKLAIRKWICGLHDNISASGFTRELVKFTQQRMLEPTAAKRATASEVTSHLDRMLERSGREPPYMEPLTPLPELNAIRLAPTFINPFTSATGPATLSSSGRSFFSSPSTFTTSSMSSCTARPWHSSPMTQQQLSFPLTTGPSMSTLFGGLGEQNTAPLLLTYNHITPRGGNSEQLRALIDHAASSRKRQRLSSPNVEDMFSAWRRPTLHGRSMPENKATEERLFACPFHQHNPEKFSGKNWRACMGPGWDISRLKEHIYRRHFRRVFRCNRCLSEFDTSDALKQHKHANPPCNNRVQSESSLQIEDIDETQKARIQRRERGKSQEGKWREIYRIIFHLDGVSPPALPSPFYENPSAANPFPEADDDQQELPLLTFSQYTEASRHQRLHQWNFGQGYLPEIQFESQPSTASVAREPSFVSDAGNGTAGWPSTTTMADGAFPSDAMLNLVGGSPCLLEGTHGETSGPRQVTGNARLLPLCAEVSDSGPREQGSSWDAFLFADAEGLIDSEFG